MGSTSGTTVSASMVPWVYPITKNDIDLALSNVGSTSFNYRAWPMIFARPRKIDNTLNIIEQIKAAAQYATGVGGDYAGIWFFLKGETLSKNSFAFPIASVSSDLIKGSGEGWNNIGAETLNKIFDFAKRDPLVVPQYSVTGGNDTYSISAEFTIFNKDSFSYALNKAYIKNLIELNTQHVISGRDKDGGISFTNFNAIEPPCLFELLIPGIAWVPACKASFSFAPVGVVRKYGFDFVPDAWKVNLTFTAMIPMKKSWFTDIGYDQGYWSIRTDETQGMSTLGAMKMMVAGDEYDVDINFLFSGIIGGNFSDPYPALLGSRSSIKKIISATGEVCFNPPTPIIGAVKQFEGADIRFANVMTGKRMNIKVPTGETQVENFGE